MENLKKIQQELKAPKDRFNSFGKYNYRSCEDILEKVKPLLAKYNCLLLLNDQLQEVCGRVYICATATFVDSDGETASVSACAQDGERKGMDIAQCTGASSSYARKYALNGLFLLDDNKDPDTDEWQRQQQNTQKQPKPKAAEQPKLAPIQNKSYKDMTAEEVYKVIDAAAKSQDITDIMNAIKAENYNLFDKVYPYAMSRYNTMKNNNK